MSKHTPTLSPLTWGTMSNMYVTATVITFSFQKKFFHNTMKLKEKRNVILNTISACTSWTLGFYFHIDHADAFAKHFQSVHNNCCSIDLLRLSQCSEFLSLVRVSDADVCKAIKTLKLSKSVGLDDITGFILKGSSAIFIPILRHIFNLSLT
jgi:hypothetical protein